MILRILLAWACAVVVTSADEVHLKSGGKVVGTVTDEGDPVILKTPGGGTIRIARAKIDRIEKKALPADATGGTTAAPKRDTKTPPSPRHVDLFGAFAVRPPPGWKRIPAAKGSAVTFVAPEDVAPFRLDVWIVKSDAELKAFFDTFAKTYRGAFKEYVRRWEKPGTLGGREAYEFSGTFTDDAGEKRAHVHSIAGGPPGKYFLVFFTGRADKLDALAPAFVETFASFEGLPSIELTDAEKKAFMDARAKAGELVEAGKFAEAAAELEKAAEILPRHADTHQDLAILHGKLGDMKRAIEEYTTVIGLRPDDPLPRFNLGTLLFQANRFPDAVARFEEAIDLAPDFADAWVNLGTVHTQLAAYDKAVECFKTAIDIDAKETAAWYNLGQVHYARNRYKEARDAWEQALKIDPDHAGAKDGLAKLKQEGH